MSDSMKVENNRINPVALAASAAAGGALGMMAKPAYAKTKASILAMNQDNYIRRAAVSTGSFLQKYFGKEAFKGYWSAITTKFSAAKAYVAEKASAVYHSSAMKKVGAFLKHPATIGVVVGAGVYYAATKFFGKKDNEEYID